MTTPTGPAPYSLTLACSFAQKIWKALDLRRQNGWRLSAVTWEPVARAWQLPSALDPTPALLFPARRTRCNERSPARGKQATVDIQDRTPRLCLRAMTMQQQQNTRSVIRYNSLSVLKLRPLLRPLCIFPMDVPLLQAVCAEMERLGIQRLSLHRQ